MHVNARTHARTHPRSPSPSLSRPRAHTYIHAHTVSLSLTHAPAQVIAVAKSADLVLMMLDATKPDAHRQTLEAELESTGIRLNRQPPDIYFKKKKTGGIKFNTMVPLTKMGAEPASVVHKVLQEYKCHNCEVVFREDCDIDDFIDLLEGNRRCLTCLCCYNQAVAVCMCIFAHTRTHTHTHTHTHACTHTLTHTISYL